MKVTVVLDPTFGAHNDALSEPWWIVDSVANRALAEKLRALPEFDPNSAVFKVGSTTSVEAAAIGIFGSIERHLPDWKEMEFVGVPLSREIGDTVTNWGLTVVPTINGFVLTDPDRPD